MRYFLIEENSKIAQRARIINWYEKIDVRNICPENAHKLPQRELVFIMDSAETIFIDVISTPFFLASKKVMKTIQMYEPRVMLKELVLLGRIYEKVERYYLPIFEEVECLGHGSVLNLNRSEVIKFVLDLNP